VTDRGRFTPDDREILRVLDAGAETTCEIADALDAPRTDFTFRLHLQTRLGDMIARGLVEHVDGTPPRYRPKAVRVTSPHELRAAAQSTGAGVAWTRADEHGVGARVEGLHLARDGAQTVDLVLTYTDLTDDEAEPRDAVVVNLADLLAWACRTS
jgi:hypothetical protein